MLFLVIFCLKTIWPVWPDGSEIDMLTKYCKSEAKQSCENIPRRSLHDVTKENAKIVLAGVNASKTYLGKKQQSLKLEASTNPVKEFGTNVSY